MRPRPRSDQRNSAAEDAEESHVTFNEGHVHEPSLHKANKLLINTQSNISRREDDSLGVFYLSLLDRHILVQCDSSVSPEQSVHSDYLLALVFCIRRPSDRDGRSFTVNVDKVARSYCELLHRLIINSNLPMADVSLLSVSYP